jgi:D-methionine transport system substrate-binding protein
VLEGTQHNSYANLLVAKDTEVNDPRVRKLEQLLHSPQVKKFIDDKYQGSVIPPF